MNRKKWVRKKHSSSFEFFPILIFKNWKSYYSIDEFYSNRMCGMNVWLVLFFSISLFLLFSIHYEFCQILWIIFVLSTKSERVEEFVHRWNSVNYFYVCWNLFDRWKIKQYFNVFKHFYAYAWTLFKVIAVERRVLW